MMMFWRRDQNGYSRAIEVPTTISEGGCDIDPIVLETEALPQESTPHLDIVSTACVAGGYAVDGMLVFSDPDR
jgi:hypothetical protein